MEKVFNAAFIGCGGIARKKHLPVCKADEHIRIAALYNRSKTAAEECRAQFGGEKTYIADSAEQIFADNNIDLVFIATANDSHCELAVKALESGKHVICEKPMAMNYTQAVKMYEVSVSSGKLLHISYQNRYSQQARYTKRLIDEGFTGHIYCVKAHAIRRRAVPGWGRFTDKTVQGGGALIDIGSHAIDLALYLSGCTEAKYAVGCTYDLIGKAGSEANYWGAWETEKFTVEDSAFGFVRLDKNVSLSVEASYAMNVSEEKEAVVDIYGEKGGIELKGDGSVVQIEERAGKMTVSTDKIQLTSRVTLPESSPDPFELEHAAYMKLLLDGNFSDPALKQAMTVSQIVDGIYLSSEKGVPIIF